MKYLKLGDFGGERRSSNDVKFGTALYANCPVGFPPGQWFSRWVEGEAEPPRGDIPRVGSNIRIA